MDHDREMTKLGCILPPMYVCITMYSSQLILKSKDLAKASVNLPSLASIT